MTREEAKLTIDYLKEMQEEYIEGEGYERHPLPEWYALDKAIEAIEQTTTKERIIEHFVRLPSAERRGRWEDVEHAPNGLLYATCSVCGKRQTVECTNYCGNCGARMEASE